MSVSLDKLETPALLFDSHQDALDFAEQIVKDGKDWLAINKFNILECYEDVKLEIVLELRPWADGEHFHLIFRSIPNVVVRHRKETISGTHVASNKWKYSSSEWSDDFVLIGIANLIKHPQQIIPSEVRLEPAKERLNFFGQVFGSSESIGHLMDASSEGESGEFRGSFPRSDSDRICRIIECVSEIGDQIPEHIADSLRQWFCNLDLVNGESGPIRIVLSDLFVGLEIDERFNSLFKVGKVFLSPCDLAVRTGERIGHGME